MVPRRAEPYRFDPKFEAIVVTLSCCKQRFYGRVGHELDPELLKSENAKLAMRAARAIALENGAGPSSAVLVLQRLRRWMSDGKVSFEQINELNDYFDDAIDAGLPDEDAVILELAPIIQQRIRDSAVQAGIDSFSKKGDLSKVVELESRASRVGNVDTSIGSVLGVGSFDAISKMRFLNRLKTGIFDLDLEILGLQNGGLGIWLGASGDGKSMALSHTAAQNVIDKLHVGYITLELPVEVIEARIMANITGVPIDAILSGDDAVVRSKLRRLEEEGRMGRLVTKEMPPNVSTVEDVKDWVKMCEDQAGKAMDLLVVDYGDKLVAKAKKGEKEASEYHTGKIVFESLRLFAHEKRMFCWTASQATRKKDRKKRLDLNDTADSMHKIRVADLVVTLNLDEDGDETGGSPMLKLYVAKHRMGKSRFEVGPFPTEYALGRVCTISEDD